MPDDVTVDDDNDFININLDDVQTGREPIPDGLHLYKILTSTPKPAKEEGKHPFVELDMLCMDPPYENKRVMHWIHLGPKSLWATKLFVEATGTRWTTKGFRASDLIGKLVRCTTTRQEGTDYNRLNLPYYKA